MSDELQTAATIASLRAEVERLKADNAFMRGFINNEDVRSDFQTATAMRQALDTARERAGVLEMEVRAWRTADGYLDLTHEVATFMETHHTTLQLAMGIVDDTHALDAAKFGGAK